MAEFQQVMGIAKRRYKNIGFESLDFLKMEKEMLKWAAEHPEPVYPTWQEWFDTFERGIDVDEPIPADIAEKLGIEPKEV